MKKKIRCPECGGDESHITMWRNGSNGFSVYYHKEYDEIHYDDLEYDELSFETFSCDCGYENTDEKKFLVEVRE